MFLRFSHSLSVANFSVSRSLSDMHHGLSDRSRHDDGGDDLGQCRDRAGRRRGLFAIATVTAAITLFVLALLPPIERYFEQRAGIDPDQHRDRSL